jgi:hypothetical protein
MRILIFTRLKSTMTKLETTTWPTMKIAVMKIPAMEIAVMKSAAVKTAVMNIAPIARSAMRTSQPRTNRMAMKMARLQKKIRPSQPPRRMVPRQSSMNMKMTMPLRRATNFIRRAAAATPSPIVINGAAAARIAAMEKIPVATARSARLAVSKVRHSASRIRSLPGKGVRSRSPIAPAPIPPK